jgi:hypothetical protein
MKTKHYSLILILFLLVLLLVVGSPVDAYTCFGEGPSDWCSGGGRCVGQDMCACYAGYSGPECEMANFCGAVSCVNCNQPNGLCSARGPTGSCYCAAGHYGSCCQYSMQGTLLPQGFDFGNVNVGSTDTMQPPITYSSPTSTNDTTVETISLGGASPGDFALGSGTCVAGTDVTGGGNCTISVTFTPTATGTRSATLVVTTRDPDGSNPQTLTTTLTGTGITTVSSLLVDPRTPAHVFAGLDGAGIYRSTNSGGLWSLASLSPVTTRIKALVIEQSDSTRLFAATYGGGVYTSTDSGAHWSACANTNLANLNVLSLVSDSTGKLYAGTEAGVFTSPDCNTWTPQNSGLP